MPRILPRFLITLMFTLALPVLAGTAADDVQVVDPWAREVPPVMSTTAGFLTLKNTGNSQHKLISADSDAAGHG